MTLSLGRDILGELATALFLVQKRVPLFCKLACSDKKSGSRRESLLSKTTKRFFSGTETIKNRMVVVRACSRRRQSDFLSVQDGVLKTMAECSSIEQTRLRDGAHEKSKPA